MSRAPGASAGRASPDAEALRRDGPLPAYRLTGWEEAHPGLRAGVTAGAEAGDLGVATERPPAEWAERMEALAGAAGARRVVLPRQVHGRRVLEAAGGAPPGILLAGEADGLTTDEPGTLLAVTVADCVPVFVLDPESGALALLHAGWRGTAAGVLE
ncbi:MAG: polyphenol oxidase family protein, partial [Gemmatimonadota bacterium]